MISILVFKRRVGVFASKQKHRWSKEGNSVSQKMGSSLDDASSSHPSPFHQNDKERRDWPACPSMASGWDPTSTYGLVRLP
ncbi:hypothetical protein A6R68_04269 [Neotoma lepida]|uniref:Uncharacterized protein n=1 Tax=Neotoma lepida TaxID=56216 RepID=A0A1A6GP85_NEOLE|nr:hypothetical protein A6R68_04269 [Neotoma lepida]